MHPETNTITIPFVKKNKSDLPKLKLSYFNTTTKKNEDFLMYNYVGHVKKFGFEWNHSALGFRSETKIDNSDSKKKKLFLMELTKKHNKYPSKAGLDLLYSPKKFRGVLIQSVNNIRIFNGRA